jgi:cytochrome c556
MRRSTRFTVYLGSASLAAFVFSLTTLSAGQGGQAPAPAAGTPPKPLVPVAASSVVKNPDPYIGEYVTLTATVESNLTKTAFAVDQDKTKSTGQDVLVLAPTLQQPADANGYVTVIGQLIKFDPAEVTKNLKGYTIDLSPADLEKYKGKPVVLATAVINSGGIDIAKKPIPPMTADDLALQKIMTKLPPAQAALRKALDGKDLNLVKEQATIIKTAFTDTEAFWKARGNTEAMNIAAEAKKHADAILINIGLGSMEAAKTSITPLGATCASCHGKFRDRMDDGTFRIKPLGS